MCKTAIELAEFYIFYLGKEILRSVRILTISLKIKDSTRETGTTQGKDRKDRPEKPSHQRRLHDHTLKKG